MEKLAKIKLLLFALLVCCTLGCDRLTKDIAREHLEGKGMASYLNDTFRLVYVENPGAAMSFGAGWDPSVKFWILTLLPLGVLCVVLAYSLRNLNELGWLQLTGLGLVISGGAGNLLDRLLNNHLVPDFMNLGFNELRTGIFNVADVCITLGILLTLVSFRKSG
jgi:signal peptidase II